MSGLLGIAMSLLIFWTFYRVGLWRGWWWHR